MHLNNFFTVFHPPELMCNRSQLKLELSLYKINMRVVYLIALQLAQMSSFNNQLIDVNMDIALRWSFRSFVIHELDIDLPLKNKQSFYSKIQLFLNFFKSFLVFLTSYSNKLLCDIIITRLKIYRIFQLPVELFFKQRENLEQENKISHSTRCCCIRLTSTREMFE